MNDNVRSIVCVLTRDEVRELAKEKGLNVENYWSEIEQMVGGYLSEVVSDSVNTALDDLKYFYKEIEKNVTT